MVFEIPTDLAPEVYPLAWLVGKWHGYAHISYPGIEAGWFVHEIQVDHDGGPYLRMVSTIWQSDKPAQIEQGTVGITGYQQLSKGLQWSTETSYWRVPPGQQIGPSEGEKAGQMPPTALEVLATDPAGHLVLYAAVAQGPRIQMVSDQIIRSGSAPELLEVRRMYGLLKTELLWVQEMAAFGKEIADYGSGQLSRV